MLDDGILREQTRERFDRVMGSKMHGAWYLHELTRDDPLDHFVLFSSAASLVGSPGQGNYAAANAFLDALAHQRRWEKRPALSVNWGAWAEVGMAARLSEAEGRRLAAAGLGAIEPTKGLRTLEQLITDGSTQAGVMPIDWPKFFERIPAGSEPAWLADMARDARAAADPATAGPTCWRNCKGDAGRAARGGARAHSQAGGPRAGDRRDESARSAPDAERAGLRLAHRGRIRQPRGPIDRPAVQPGLLFDYPTLEALSGYVVRDLLQLDCEGGPAAAEPADAEGRAAAGGRSKKAARRPPPPCRRCRRRGWTPWCRGNSNSSRA